MRRHLLASAILATLLSLPLSLATATVAAPTCAGAGPNHSTLVVTHADGSTVTRCVAFTADSINGQQLLDTSGIKWSGQSFSFGEAVCAIDGEPAAYTECLGKDNYWAAFTAGSDGTWQLAMVGISDITLHDGEAEGFRYVPTTGTATEPSSPKGVCAAQAAPASGSAAAATVSSAGSPTSAASANPTVASSSQPAPSSGSSGPDVGLVAAGVVAVGLIGLAAIRLLMGRHPAQ
jgi:hypothetical protein